MANLFHSLRGHDSAKVQIQTALHNNRLPHAMIFAGPSGVGKKLFAKALSQILLCEKYIASSASSHATVKQACGECGICQRIEKEQSESVLFIKPEGTQIKLEQARDIHHFLQLKLVTRARVIIIDDAHTLNPQTSNNLLKILEEPPAQTYFILITPNLSSLLPTIRSRSQILRFQPLNANDLKELTNAPQWVIASAQGRLDRLNELNAPEMRDSREQALELLSMVLDKNSGDAFAEIKGLTKEKEQTFVMLHIWQQALRDAWLLKTQSPGIIHVDQKHLLEKFAQLSHETIGEMLSATLQIEQDMLGNVDRALLFENFWLRFQPQM